jgi:D-psicose/D-tagatose/L-ribulose 3-epimerase
MKYGMNLLLWTTHVSDEHYPLLAKLKKTGFDGVEIPLFQGDLAHYQRLGLELRSQGLGATAVCCCGPDTNPISPDAGIRKKANAHLKWAIEMTAALGGTVLAGPYHSAIGVFSGAGPTAAERQCAVEVLRGAAEEAKKNKVLLTIEYLNRFECYFLTTAAEAKSLVLEVGHPSFRMMYDTFHANIEEKDITKAITSAGEVIGHVHISENDRGTPGTGHVHWAETFKALKQIRYDGWVTIEAFGRAMPELAAATKVWRDLFPSPEEVYTKGLAFVKANVEKS